MSQPTVFISYSHKDERWKDLLLPHLKSLEQLGLLEIWDDRKIESGETWYPEIQRAMERAAVAVCLISADYLASDFCVKKEIPFLLERCERDGMLLLPVQVRRCFFEVVPWLNPIQMLPRDGKSIAVDFEGKEDVIFTEVARRIHDVITKSSYTANELEQIRYEFRAASQNLLRWPRRLVTGEWIEQPALEKLMTKIRETESSTTLLLGPPGSGKSALLAELGSCLASEGITLLALKADMLSQDVKTITDLKQELNLSLNPVESIGVLARAETVVILVDQLDAVAEIMDRKSERLNVLLGFIKALSDRTNVHVVATTRIFEYRHDTRLATIEADTLELSLPGWELLSPILDREGYKSQRMSEEVKKLLRVPMHLNLFLDLASPGKEFTSLQSMLEELWTRKVTSAEGPDDRNQLVALLAEEMAKREVLWLPVPVASDYRESMDVLLSDGILSYRDDDRRFIGFRHQTYFDFALARTFASGQHDLAEFVLKRQEGLFVRPYLLSGLNYLRGGEGARSVYYDVVRRLFQSGARLHIRALLIDYLAGRSDPDVTESQLLLPLLDDDSDGQRVLYAIAVNEAWFDRLINAPGFERWMRGPTEKTRYALSPLTEAARRGDERVVDLIEMYWAQHQKYDPFSLSVLTDLTVWSNRAVELATRLVRRTNPYSVDHLINRVAEDNPVGATRVLGAHLHLLTEEFRLRSNGASSKYSTTNYPILTNHRHNILDLAEAAPKAFIDEVLPVLKGHIEKNAYPEHDFVVGYREDPMTYRSWEDEDEKHTLLYALYRAVDVLACSDPSGFLALADANESSDFLIVHRLLARGYRELVTTHAEKVLEYLLGEDRRLIIGDREDRFRETKALITSLYPNLDTDQRRRLEEAVIRFKYYKAFYPSWTEEERDRRIGHTRESRLRLLRAFPESLMSPELKRLWKSEEEELPGVQDWDFKMTGMRVVVAPVSKEEMTRMPDEDLLSLLNEMEKRSDSSFHISQEGDTIPGGAEEQASELGQLAKSDPHRVAMLIRSFSPEQEGFVCNALVGIAESEYPVADCYDLIRYFVAQGFSSNRFKEKVAEALEKCAYKNKGLPEDMLALLEKWLAEHPEPSVMNSDSSFEARYEREKFSPIFFGMGAMDSYGVIGRTSIINALASGFLLQEQPDIENWDRLIQNRINHERHPRIWALTMKRMPVLFNKDKAQATQRYDEVIKACPDVLRMPMALGGIASILGLSQPKTTEERWLDRLCEAGSRSQMQAYGELLVLYNCRLSDEWSTERIRYHLRDTSDADTGEEILVGMAYAAAHLWRHHKCRPMATEILVNLSKRESEHLQHAVANVFFQTERHETVLSQELRDILNAAREKREILLKAAGAIVKTVQPYIESDPDLVYRTCTSVLDAIEQSEAQRNPIWSVAEELTQIAITLHRIPTHREDGLTMFERLIDMNVREARAALEILDRKPLYTFSKN